MEHKIPEHTPAAIAEPGMIMRLSQSIGATNDVFQLEGFVDRDASQGEIDHLAEKMVRAAAKVKAKADLPNLRRSHENVEHKHNENRKRLAELNARETAEYEIRLEKIQQLEVRSASLFAVAEASHVGSGRRGAFKPEGHVKSEIGGVKSQIDELQRAGVNAQNEAAIQRSTLDNELKEGERALAQLSALITETEAVARGEDISGV